MQAYFLADKSRESFEVGEERQIVDVDLEELPFDFLKLIFWDAEPFIPLIASTSHHQFEGLLEGKALSSVEEKHALLAGSPTSTISQQ